VLPPGIDIVKLTFAPETVIPPFSTLAVSETVLRAVKLAPATDKLAVIEGGLITVIFAVAEPAFELSEAIASTA
jgi:hypothetical protein